MLKEFEAQKIKYPDELPEVEGRAGHELVHGIATVADRHGRPFTYDTLDLAQHCGAGITIEGVVREGQCANDDATDLGHGHGCLRAELVFLMCLALLMQETSGSWRL
jgi:hypothetical protein